MNELGSATAWKTKWYGFCDLYDPNTGGSHANINPLRYRGYVYDTDTGLYYLQSRYYDPKVGRFINADSYASTGQGILGNNMFAYCNNNPISYHDQSGRLPVENDELGIHMSTFGGGAELRAGPVPWDENGNLKTSRYNTDIQTVLEAERFAFYKGILVVKIPGERSGYFGIICLTPNATEDTLRHEYGHSYQMAKLGPIKYALCIGLPSWLEWGSQEYYERPWEVVADVEGGVLSRTHDQSTTQAGYNYLNASNTWGPLVWFTIK